MEWKRGVGAALGHVHLDGARGPREAWGHVVREQVHPVVVLREGQGELARHDAGAAVGGVTEDPDTHGTIMVGGRRSSRVRVLRNPAT